MTIPHLELVAAYFRSKYPDSALHSMVLKQQPAPVHMAQQQLINVVLAPASQVLAL